MRPTVMASFNPHVACSLMIVSFNPCTHVPYDLMRASFNSCTHVAYTYSRTIAPSNPCTHDAHVANPRAGAAGGLFHFMRFASRLAS